MVIPDQNLTGEEYFYITTEKAIVLLPLAVDYEGETAYTVIMEVVDFMKTPPMTGSITLKVSAPICDLTNK